MTESSAQARRRRSRRRTSADECARIVPWPNMPRSVIRDRRPDTVVVQNYVLPALEGPVFDAVRETGARLVIVVHDHRLHTWKAGTRAGFAKRLQSADVVVAHTNFVAEGVRAHAGRADVRVIPLPVQVGMLRRGTRTRRSRIPVRCWPATSECCGAPTRVPTRSGRSRSTASTAGRSWRWAPARRSSYPESNRSTATSTPRASLRLLAEMDAIVLPYRFATQSGVTVLGQALGAVPIASAVGGLPEQIEDGVDGLLVHPTRRSTPGWPRSSVSATSHSASLLPRPVPMRCGPGMARSSMRSWSSPRDQHHPRGARRTQRIGSNG